MSYDDFIFLRVQKLELRKQKLAYMNSSEVIQVGK